MTSVLGAIVQLNSRDHYIHWGFILISLANLLVIVAMLVLFVAALTVPFIHSRRKSRETLGQAPLPVQSSEGHAADATENRAEEAGLWTAALRRIWLKALPPSKLLPDSQPAYVASWIYVFGVLTLAGLTLAILSGLVLALEGPVWWHTSSVGLFVNSLHLWSVECFMGFMAIHLWGKFWMAAWRGRRALTWMTGALAFLVSVFEAFTGYLSQTNFDSQWVAFEAKDAMNAGGIGAFFNTMNFGQALMLHIVFVPLVLVAIVAIHILMVRVRGVVHPIDALAEHSLPASEDLGEPAAASTARGAMPLAGSLVEHGSTSLGGPELSSSRASGSTGAL